MINKIEKLLDLCIEIAERKLNEPTNQLPLPLGPADVVLAPAAAAVPAEEPKKTRKPRTSKVGEPAAPAGEEQFKGDGTEGLEDQLGMGTGAPEELTEAESKSKMEEVTKQYVSLCKNDTPEDGKTRAIALMKGPRFGVAKLGDLSHQQRLQWIKHMEAGIVAHK